MQDIDFTALTEGLTAKEIRAFKVSLQGQRDTAIKRGMSDDFINFLTAEISHIDRVQESARAEKRAAKALAELGLNV